MSNLILYSNSIKANIIKFQPLFNKKKKKKKKDNFFCFLILKNGKQFVSRKLQPVDDGYIAIWTVGSRYIEELDIYTLPHLPKAKWAEIVISSHQCFTCNIQHIVIYNS